jgi:hypothetical protein
MLDALRDACWTHCVTHAGPIPGGCLVHGQQTVLVFLFNYLVKFQGQHRLVVISGFAGPGECFFMALML